MKKFFWARVLDFLEPSMRLSSNVQHPHTARSNVPYLVVHAPFSWDGLGVSIGPNHVRALLCETTQRRVCGFHICSRIAFRQHPSRCGRYRDGYTMPGAHAGGFTNGIPTASSMVRWPSSTSKTQMLGHGFVGSQVAQCFQPFFEIRLIRSGNPRLLGAVDELAKVTIGNRLWAAPLQLGRPRAGPGLSK